MNTITVKNWMTKELNYNRNDYDDCGEINTTLLAENAADELSLYEGEEYTIPEEVFEIAFEISKRF